MPSTKKKLNLTIDEGVIEGAKRLSGARGESLSALVEGFLARLVADLKGCEEDSLDAFYQKHIGPGYIPATDAQIRNIREELLEKHS